MKKVLVMSAIAFAALAFGAGTASAQDAAKTPAKTKTHHHKKHHSAHHMAHRTTKTTRTDATMAK